MNLFSFNHQSAKRVLLIHPFGIGDALFITPVIRTLKENGAEQIDLFLGSRTREVFEHNPNINHIFEWNKVRPDHLKEKLNALRDLAKLYYQIWKNRYSVMLDFSPAAKFAFPSWIFFWIPVRVGFNFKGKGYFLTHKINLPDGYSEKFMVQYYLDLVRILGLAPKSEKTEFIESVESASLADHLLQELKVDLDLPILAVAPGGGESWGKDARLKRWPVHHFAGLIQKVCTKNKSGTILILGSKNERNLAEELISYLNGMPVLNLCGEIPIHTVAALLKKSKFLIANDSGLVHLADALDVPVVAIFGPVDPKVYAPQSAQNRVLAVVNEGPVCRPCYQRFKYQSACTGLECLNELTPEKVYQKIESAGFLSADKSTVLK